MKFIKVTVICIVFSLITGCVSTGKVGDIENKAEDTIKNIEDKEEYFNSLKSDNEYEYVKRVDEPYFKASSFDGLTPKTLMESKGHIKMAKSQINESSIFSALFKMYEGKIKLEDGIFDTVEVKENLSFEGTKKGVMDYICHIYDCSWSYDDIKGLIVSKFETRKWDIDFLPLTYEMSASLQSTSTAGANGGGAAQSGASGTGGQNALIQQESIDLYKELDNTIKQIKTADGTYSLNKGLGLLMVKDRPVIISQIDEIVKGLHFLNSDVAIYVDVFQVQSTDTAEIGLEIDAVYNNLSDGVRFGTGVRSLVGLNADTVGIGVTDENSRFFNSSVLIKALKEKMNIVSHIQKVTLTKNRKSTVISNLSNFPYEEITSSAVPNAGVTNSSTIFERPVGTNISLLPVITGLNKITMQLSYFNSEVIGQFIRVGLGNTASSSFPLTEDNKNMLEFTLTSGKPLIVAADVRSVKSKSSRSLSKANSEEYNSLVLMITAKIIDNNYAIQ